MIDQKNVQVNEIFVLGWIDRLPFTMVWQGSMTRKDISTVMICLEGYELTVTRVLPVYQPNSSLVQTYPRIRLNWEMRLAFYTSPIGKNGNVHPEHSQMVWMP